MMSRRAAKSCLAAGALAAFLAAMGLQSVAAQAGSLQEFFAEQFGVGAPQPQPAPMWTETNPYDHPLVVRPRHRKLRTVARLESPAVKGPVGPVSIYEDKTLRRGDAVMTEHGIRIFRGSATMPYRDSDFVALSDQDGLSRDVTKTLVAMDRVPRN